MIPNTTPIPNKLFDVEMKQMGDAELRVVMIVARATFGWVIDRKTGMRKQEDWISHSQMIKFTGKSSRAIKYAVQNSIESGWIEARGSDGELLDTGEKRRKYGRKIFYRIGPKLLNLKPYTSANNAQVEPVQIKTATSAKNDTKPVQIMHCTKETLTKETLTKPATASVARNKAQFDPLGAEIIKAFEDVDSKNKTYYANKTQRSACDFLLSEHGLQEVLKRVSVLNRTNKMAYFPKINSPYDLKEKWVKLQDMVESRRAEIKSKSNFIQ